jgi:hypothetical protein
VCLKRIASESEKIEQKINSRHRTNAAQTRFRIATSQPNGYFVFLLTRLSDNATNVVLKFKVFANHGPAAALRRKKEKKMWRPQAFGRARGRNNATTRCN